jgi:aspartyl-tRNA(Asn)/glutamyl-tRNA(Gln) amidotransferase subunit A
MPAASTVAGLAERVRRREVSATRLTEAALDAVHAGNSDINAFISIYADDALSSAREADRRIAAGDYRGPLDGIPVAIKDNLYMRGRKTTMGSKIHGDFVPDYTATAVERLAAAGAIIVGKTNMHEYALGATTDNPYFGTCRNPWDTDRIPGGSSGGSAAAVAAKMVPGTLGSDTSGSIRIPASMCGVVGLKPTYGRVSRYGCFPEAWTLDHVGPIAASVADAAILLDVISGWDPKDPASLQRPPTSTFNSLRTDLTGTVIGVEKDFYFADVDDDISSLVTDVIDQLRRLGAVIRPVNVGGLRDGMYALTIIDTAETTTVHQATLRERPDDYGPEVRFLLECGALPSAVDYLTAQQLRERLRDQFRTTFQQVDVLVAPTIPLKVPKIGDQVATINGTDVDIISNLIRLVGPANLVGLPSLSLPCGLAGEMPVGLQVIGKPLGEQDVLNVGLAFEQTHPMGKALGP